MKEYTYKCDKCGKEITLVEDKPEQFPFRDEHQSHSKCEGYYIRVYKPHYVIIKDTK